MKNSSHYVCSICGEPAPRMYLVHRRFSDAEKWLAKHKREAHSNNEPLPKNWKEKKDTRLAKTEMDKLDTIRKENEERLKAEKEQNPEVE